MLGGMSAVDFATLTIDQVGEELDRTTGDVRAAFGPFDARRLNWRPGAAVWSVAPPFASRSQEPVAPSL